MRLSKFGKRFSRDAGILRLMDDLGAALASGREVISLGGGNPSHIPEVEAVFKDAMRALLDHGDAFERVVGNYDGPAGSRRFCRGMAKLLKRQFGWPVGPENVIVTNGSQSAFFFLFNMFAGDFEDGVTRQILLPLTPEYIGYADLGLVDDLFVANRPEIEFLDGRTFKYRVALDRLAVSDRIGAICVSRPTNPTGNVLTDGEMERLLELSADHDIPLIVDNAYGTPFPNIIFSDATPVWNERTVVCMSLSKLGLPGLRTGIVIANEEVVSALAGMNAILSLAPMSIGAALALDLVRSGKVIELSETLIKPHYERRAHQAVAILERELTGYEVFIHKPEGAIFLWVWFRNLPITTEVLYERLKRRGVLVVAGRYFFPGLREDWRHVHECIRVTYAEDMDRVERGLAIIADEVRRAYDGGGAAKG